MDEISKKWDSIVAKVNLILQQNDKYKDEISRLKDLLHQKEIQNEQLLKDKEELEKNINILKLAKGVGLSEQERSAVKKQIKFYIEEIDECLAKINA